YNTVNASINFIDCKSSYIKFDGNNCFNRAIVIDNCDNIEKLLISNTTVENGGVNIKKSKLKVSLEIVHSNLDIRISNSEISLFRIESYKGDCSIIKSVFEKSVD